MLYFFVFIPIYVVHKGQNIWLHRQKPECYYYRPIMIFKGGDWICLLPTAITHYRPGRYTIKGWNYRLFNLQMVKYWSDPCCHMMVGKTLARRWQHGARQRLYDVGPPDKKGSARRRQPTSGRRMCWRWANVGPTSACYLG